MDWWREKEKKKEKEKEKERSLERGATLLEELIECCDGKSNPIKFFSFHQICKATNNFSDSNCVFGLSFFYCDWYTGTNENHPMILIKRSDDFFLRLLHEKQDSFCRDIAISSMVSGHKNFMKLVGCCLEPEDALMIYHGEKKHDRINRIIRELQWEKRMKIAEDIATALAYLHTAFPRPFVYRNMSLENILLDEDGVAKLANFYYCVSIPKGETFVKVNKNKLNDYGDIYKDSKYMRDGVVSVETDVYAFGILMQKLLNGVSEFVRSDVSIIEKEVQRRDEQNRLLKLMEEGRMDEIADPDMLEMMGEISEEEICQMKAFLMLSQRCISGEGEVPTMVEVAKELKKIRRSLKNDSSSPSGETLFCSPQDIASSSSQTRATKALLTSIAHQVFDEMFQWVMLSWFRFFRKNRRMC